VKVCRSEIFYFYFVELLVQIKSLAQKLKIVVPIYAGLSESEFSILVAQHIGLPSHQKVPTR